MTTQTAPISDQGLTTPPVRRWLAISRRRAFLTHLLCSATVVAFVCLLMLFVWYPQPFFQISNAWRPLRVLVGVDLVLGPALTLLLFKPGKKGLLFDLVTIVLVQLAALIYGVTVIYTQRPYFNVFSVDRFVVQARKDVDAAEWTKVSGRFGGKPWIGPVWAIANLPKDAAGNQRIIQGLMSGGHDIEQRPELWSPYKDGIAQVTARIKPLGTLKARQPAMQQRIDHLPAKLGLPNSCNIAFVLLRNVTCFRFS